MANERTPTDWLELIVRNKANHLDRLERRLFADLVETMSYVHALSAVRKRRAKGAVVPLPAGYHGRVAAVRKAFVTLPLERAVEAFDALPEDVGVWYVVLGAYKASPAECEQVVGKMLDICEAKYRLRRFREKPDVRAFDVLVEILEWQGMGVSDVWGSWIGMMDERDDSSPLLRFMEIFQLAALPVEVLEDSRWSRELDVVHGSDGAPAIRIPVPDAYAAWFRSELSRHVAAATARYDGYLRLLSDIRTRFDAYEASYQDMWLDMMTQPAWDLRDGGRDRADIVVPGMRAFGYQGLRLELLEPFPQVRASFTFVTVLGDEREVELSLEPSMLATTVPSYAPTDKDDWGYDDALLAFVAVRAMWTIVTGQLSKRTETKGVCRGGGWAGVVRRRFRHLPEGQKASPEARARALDAFRHEPLPGFTFVKQYAVGQPNTTNRPVLSLVTLEP